ncbi:Uma2 family endonuclease [Streptomyces sparsogenes]
MEPLVTSVAPESDVPDEPAQQWPCPPAGGYTADHLDRLPNLPPHTELIDGSLVFVHPQTAFHARAMRLLENHLLQAAPPEWEVARQMTITLGPRDRPEPDVLVVKSEGLMGPGHRSDRDQPPSAVAALVKPLIRAHSKGLARSSWSTRSSDVRDSRSAGWFSAP